MRIWAGAAVCALAAIAAPRAQTSAPGKVQFERLCARCHGADGRGGEMGPGIVSRLALRTDDELAALVRDGLPAKGMPGQAVPDADLRALVAFTRTLRPGRADAPARLSVTMADGSAVHGVALNRTATDAQLLADGGDLHLLRRAGDAWRRVTSQADWPTYHGDRGGNRYSTGRPDQSRHGRAPRAGVGVPAARRLEPAGDAGRGRRRDVRHQRQRVLRAGRRVGAAHLALSAAADEGPRRRRRLGDQPRRGGGRRPRLHGHRPRPPHRAQPLHRRSRVGDADGRLAAELRRHVRAARRRQPGRVGDLGRRRRRPRLPRRVRSRERQGSVAVLDRAARAASPAPRPGAAPRSRTAAPRRG